VGSHSQGSGHLQEQEGGW